MKFRGSISVAKDQGVVRQVGWTIFECKGVRQRGLCRPGVLLENVSLKFGQVLDAWVWRSCPGASRWRTGRLSAAQKVSADCVVRATFFEAPPAGISGRFHGGLLAPTSSRRGFWGTISAEALDVRLIRNSILALSHNPVLWDIEKDVEGGTAQMRARLTNGGISAARAGGRVQSWQRCMGRRTTFSQQCVCKKGSTSQSTRVARQCGSSLGTSSKSLSCRHRGCCEGLEYLSGQVLDEWQWQRVLQSHTRNLEDTEGGNIVQMGARLADQEKFYIFIRDWCSSKHESSRGRLSFTRWAG